MDLTRGAARIDQDNVARLFVFPNVLQAAVADPGPIRFAIEALAGVDHGLSFIGNAGVHENLAD